MVVGGDEPTWWTWAGGRGNASLVAALPKQVELDERHPDHAVRLRTDVTRAELLDAIKAVDVEHLPSPDVTEEALAELNFADVLPRDLAVETLARRVSDQGAARQVLSEAVRWTVASLHAGTS